MNDNGPVTLFDVDQHRVSYAVHHLMSAAKDVSDLAKDQFVSGLVRLEYEDIELTRNHLNGVLERLRERSSS